MGWLGAGLLAREWLHQARFERACRDPEAIQAEVLRALLRRNAETVFGRAHGFSRIASAAEYARRVPIRDYEAFRPYVSRMLVGERAILTAEAPFMFATTSGTTGEPKWIPVTRRWADSTASLMRLWAFYAIRDHPALLDGRVLTIVSPADEGTTPSGAPFGAMSGLADQRLPWLIRRRHVLPRALPGLADPETRYLVTMRLALGQRVSSIGTPNPSTLLRLAVTASRRAEEIVQAIHDGTLGVDSAALTCEGDVLRDVAARLRPDPGRAAALAAVLARHGRLALGQCWPELALVGCWLGGNAGVQARRLADHYGGAAPLRDLGLIASEGRLTIPLEDRTAAGVLAVHASFFEFVPEDGIDEPSPRALRCHELEDGRRYYVVLTGGNGLYRYDLNDIVEVRGFYHRTPKVAFVRKGRDMVSITGEKLHLNHLLAAVGRAEATSGLDVWQFRVITDLERSGYDVLLEFQRGPGGPAERAAFLDAFDAALASVNIEYAAKRASKRLDAPRLFVMKPGWAERLCRAEFREGRRESQHKWAAIRSEWDDASRGEVLNRFDVT